MPPLVLSFTAFAHFVNPAWKGSVGASTWLNFRTYLSAACAVVQTTARDNKMKITNIMILLAFFIIIPPPIDHFVIRNMSMNISADPFAQLLRKNRHGPDADV
jgi:hypothetical protein